MNEAMATRGSNALVLDTAERSLGEEVSLVEQNASSVIVHDNASYEQAAQITKSLKQMQKKVKDYWEPLRVSAKKTYDDVLGKKKKMLDPLEQAEKILKGKMGAFVAQQERERREREDAARRAAQAETDRKLAEAADLEQQGDAMGAEMAMAEAEVYDDAAAGITVASKAPKVEGVATAKVWKITSIDASKVPVEIAGMVIRPVDEKLVLNLIKATKGQIKIPGIEFAQDISVSIRA